MDPITVFGPALGWLKANRTKRKYRDAARNDSQIANNSKRQRLEDWEVISGDDLWLRDQKRQLGSSGPDSFEELSDVSDDVDAIQEALMGHFSSARGPFRFQRMVSSGSNGITALLHDTRSNPPQVFILKRPLRNDDISGILNEIKLLKVFQGAAHIVQILPGRDRNINDPGLPGPSIAMEYLENGSFGGFLQRCIEAKERVPNRVLWHIMLCPYVEGFETDATLLWADGKDESYPWLYPMMRQLVGRMMVRDYKNCLPLEDMLAIASRAVRTREASDYPGYEEEESDTAIVMFVNRLFFDGPGGESSGSAFSEDKIAMIVLINSSFTRSAFEPAIPRKNANAMHRCLAVEEFESTLFSGVATYELGKGLMRFRN
ncbi:hypothetical protein PG999_002905 [Apiospora kogelbergensis]|uniref:Protein kinase domain-containing protein n=1 Tax=Apiospora kogelbergensis TaxID=1337665 RepID=A0AAW0R9N7_9PEZI